MTLSALVLLGLPTFDAIAAAVVVVSGLATALWALRSVLAARATHEDSPRTYTDITTRYVAVPAELADVVELTMRMQAAVGGQDGGTAVLYGPSAASHIGTAVRLLAAAMATPQDLERLRASPAAARAVTPQQMQRLVAASVAILCAIRAAGGATSVAELDVYVADDAEGEDTDAATAADEPQLLCPACGASCERLVRTGDGYKCKHCYSSEG